ncbi:MAG: homocysteine S-methyltransferase family protein [Fretibacterium sp.]|nr:homocysteine S-methyltransferase family protein [Fretibacterium sp.]
MGTMLQARGLKLRELPESLNLTHPDLIRSIHGEYLAAGADFVTTNTFGANRFKLERGGLSVPEAVGAAVKIARQAAGDRALVALDIGPTGRVLAPLGDASFDEVYNAVAEQVLSGRDGSDVVLLETFTDLHELKAAVLAVKENCDLPVFATMSFEEGGHTFFGACVESAVMTLEGLGVSALGVNCSLGPRQLLPIVERICASSHVPVMVQPNAGLPVMRNGISSYDVTPDEFAEFAAQFAKMGAAVLGGCCGTTPEHISKMTAAVRRETGGMIPPRSVPDATVICTPAQPVSFSAGDFVIIGERLNPTGKKALQAALRSGDMDYILKEALKQQDQGAHVLDVNAGLPDIDEPALLRQAVEEIQAVIDLPLQLDSASAEALDAAARAYNGKPLLNSVNGKESSLQTVLPVAKKYGACVLGLTLDENGIPPTAKERLNVARRIVEEAEKMGIPRRDVLIDCLTLTASAQQDLVKETLKAVRLVNEELGVRTVLGVSNVSFGLPRRPLVNRTMFVAALAQGLDAAIMNPGDPGMREALAAWRLLSGADRDAQDYIAWCGEHPAESTATTTAAPATETSAADRGLQQTGDGLTPAIARGLKDEAAARTRELLKTLSPLEIIEGHIVPALDSVGREYEAKRLFLPQLIKAAEAAKAAFECLKDALAARGSAASEEAKGPIALATVYGDVHDIGKNIVKVILENYNFKVLDLGKDVPPDRVVEAVKAGNIPIVGLSALMTTTVASMKETICQLRRECPHVKVIVGGAVLTPDLAEYAGADFYARDAMESVRIASKILGA